MEPEVFDDAFLANCRATLEEMGKEKSLKRAQAHIEELQRQRDLEAERQMATVKEKLDRDAEWQAKMASMAERFKDVP